MKRRTKEQNGFINYPITDKAYKDTGEGGLVTVLYVLENADFEKRWALAFNDAEFWDSSRMRFTQECMSMVWEGDKPENKVEESDMDRIIIASMHLGSTGWSGWNDAEDRMFAAGFEHLTEDGKKFIELIKKLYPEQRILLTTTLDT